MRVFANELRCAFLNKLFLAALGAGLFLAVLQFAFVGFAYATSETWNMWREGTGGVYPPSLFSTYMGMTSYSVFTVIFYYLLPVIACIPYGESVCASVERGYASQMVVRSGRLCYFISKAVSAGLAGGAAVTIPLVVNYVLTACFVPALPPEPAAMTFLVPPFSMLADLFYEHPVFYVIVFFGLAFLLAFWAALTSSALGFLMSNKYVVVLVPLAICVVLQFVLQGSAFAGLSPLDAILPYQPYFAKFWHVICVACFAMVLSSGCLVLKSVRYEGL